MCVLALEILALDRSLRSLVLVKKTPETALPLFLLFLPKNRREQEKYPYYINSSMPLSRILYLNYFVARLSNLGIIIIFYFLYCLFPTHIL